jgi:hypothetical protein
MEQAITPLVQAFVFVLGVVMVAQLGSLWARG